MGIVSGHNCWAPYHAANTVQGGGPPVHSALWHMPWGGLTSLVRSLHILHTYPHSQVPSLHYNPNVWLLVQEEEEDYQAQFPEHFAAFADLAADDDAPVDLDSDKPLERQPLQQQVRLVRSDKSTHLSALQHCGCVCVFYSICCMGMNRWPCNQHGAGCCVDKLECASDARAQAARLMLWIRADRPSFPASLLQAQQQQAAAYSARNLVQGEVLQELVAAHRAMFAGGAAAPTVAGSAASGEALVPGLSEDQQFLLSYELGTAVLRDAGLCLPAAVDGAAGTGHVMAAALRHRQLSQAPAGES